jgi:hypothetical protein
VPKENLPEIPSIDSDARFPDLSLPHDLSDPVICLLGIENYCNVLMHSYEESARRYWRAEESATNAYQLVRKGNEVMEVVGEDFEELQRHAGVHRSVCEVWQEQLRELADAASRAMPEVLLSCKVLKLHPDALYRRDNNTDWPALASDLKRLQIEAHRMVVMKREPKLFAEAIGSFLHQIGWMRSRQRYLAEKLEMYQRLLAVGEKNGDLHKLVDELIAEIEVVWKNVKSHRDKVLALAILPPHPIDGVLPQEWRFRILRDVKELAVLVGGQYSDAKTHLSDGEEKRLVELYHALESRGREADSFMDVPIVEAAQVHNYFNAPVDQRQQTIHASGNSGPIMANITGNEATTYVSISTTPGRPAHRSVWEWFGKPMVLKIAGGVVILLIGIAGSWLMRKPPFRIATLPTTTPAPQMVGITP